MTQTCGITLAAAPQRMCRRLLGLDERGGQSQPQVGGDTADEVNMLTRGAPRGTTAVCTAGRTCSPPAPDAEIVSSGAADEPNIFNATLACGAGLVGRAPDTG